MKSKYRNCSCDSSVSDIMVATLHLQTKMDTEKIPEEHSETIETKSGKKFILNVEGPTTKKVEEKRKEVFQKKFEDYHSNIKMKGKGFFSFVFEICLIILLIVGIRMYIAAPFQVDGKSMDDTLHDKDKIFINKIDSYFRTFERGDIIVFKPPYFTMGPKKNIVCAIKQKFSSETNLKKLCGEEAQHYVKRIIGIPGDTVEIQEGKYF